MVEGRENWMRIGGRIKTDYTLLSEPLGIWGPDFCFLGLGFYRLDCLIIYGN